MTTTLIGLMMIAFIALPFILSGKARKNREQKIKNSLFDLAKISNSNIDQFDLWSGSGIGINYNSKLIYFIRLVSDINESFTINLTDYKNCKLIKTSNKEGDLEEISIVLVPKQLQKETKTLPFFYSELNPQLNGEIQISEKWSKTINEILIAK